MGEKKIKCPDPKWFHQLAHGDVSEQQEAKLSAHLDDCQSCQETLDNLNDLSVLKSNSEALEFTAKDSAELSQRLKMIKSNPRQSSPQKAGYLDVSPWIDHSDNSLGRIAEFELEEFIGRGGMGVVFKCFDTKLHRYVALKLMSPQILVEASSSERFLREARSAGKINHPNVVVVYSVGEIRKLPFLVMEFVEGISLETKIKNEELDFEAVEAISRDTLKGLSAAHEQGVLHRDIKPANILIDKTNGTAKITDFGLASSTERSKITRTGLLIGTPDFLSPEQAHGKPVDQRSDLFSLGTTLYSMCCGGSPFSGDSIMTTIDNVRSTQHESLLDRNKNLPNWFSDIVDRLLKKDPDLRFASADAVLHAFDAKSLHTNSGIVVDQNSNQSPANTHASQIKWQVSLLLTLAFVGLLAFASWRVLFQSRVANPVPVQVETVTVSTFEQLIEAISEPQPTIKIAVESGVLMEIEFALEIENKDVTISSSGEPATFLVELFDEPAINLQNSSLHLNNVEMEAHREEFADDEEDDISPLIIGEQATLFLNSSSIVSYLPRVCLELEDSQCELIDSQIMAPEVAVVWYPFDDEQELRLANTVVVAAIAIRANGKADVRVELENSTVVCDTLFNVDYESFQLKELEFGFSNCLVVAETGVVRVEAEDESDMVQYLDDMKEKTQISAANCTLPRIFLVGDSGENDETVPLASVLDAELFGIQTIEIDDYTFEFTETENQIQEGEFVDFIDQFNGQVHGADYKSVGPR